jgi:hypothetical protein
MTLACVTSCLTIESVRTGRTVLRGPAEKNEAANAAAPFFRHRAAIYFTCTLPPASRSVFALLPFTFTSAPPLIELPVVA